MFDGGGVWLYSSSGVRVVFSRLTWAVIPDLRSVNFDTGAAEHQRSNKCIQMIDGCSLKLCVATHSLASSRTSPQKNLNAIARLFRDGSVRKYQFTFTFHTILHYLLALFIMHYSPSVLLYSFLHYLLFFRPSSVFSSLPLLYSPLNSFTPSTLSFSIFLHPSSPTPLVLSIIHYTLYSYSSFPSLFPYLSSYLSPLLSPPLSPTFTSCTSYTPLYLSPFITSFL